MMKEAKVNHPMLCPDQLLEEVITAHTERAPPMVACAAALQIGELIGLFR